MGVSCFEVVEVEAGSLPVRAAEGVSSEGGWTGIVVVVGGLFDLGG